MCLGAGVFAPRPGGCHVAFGGRSGPARQGFAPENKNTPAKTRRPPPRTPFPPAHLRPLEAGPLETRRHPSPSYNGHITAINGHRSGDRSRLCGGRRVPVLRHPTAVISHSCKGHTHRPVCARPVCRLRDSATAPCASARRLQGWRLSGPRARSSAADAAARVSAADVAEPSEHTTLHRDVM